VAAPARVAVLASDGDGRLQGRVEAELRARRFEVVLVPRTGSDQEALDEIARRLDAVAAVDVVRAPDRVRIRVVNLGTGKWLVRETRVDAEGSTDDATVALWAGEMVRASAVGPVVERPVPVPEPPPAVAAAPPARREGVLALAAAPAVAASVGGLDPSFQVLIDGGWWPRGGLGIEATLLLPTIATPLRRDAGEASVTVGMATLGGSWLLGPRHGRWSAQIGAGAAVALVRAQGAFAGPMFVLRDERVLAAGPYLRLGVTLALSRHLRLRADAFEGDAFRRAVIYFADQPVAQWGRPWVVGDLGVEARW
jgi:hypothetical protein